MTLSCRAETDDQSLHRLYPSVTSCNQLDRSLPSMACAKPSMGRKDPSPCFHRTFGTTSGNPSNLRPNACKTQDCSTYSGITFVTMRTYNEVTRTRSI